MKHNIVTVDTQDVLTKLDNLPVSTWNYNAEEGVQHMGPMAQDFFAAFGLGYGDTSIAGVDADGVALAAAKALSDRTKSQQTVIDAQQAQIITLQQQIAELTQRIEALEGGR